MKRLVLLVALAIPVSGLAADPYAPDKPESGSVEEIAKYTTDPKYLPASVSYVPESGSVPSPKEVLGRLSGTPGELTSSKDVHRYFEKLAEASPRVSFEKIGTSEEGREIFLAIISDEANLQSLDKLGDFTRRLADPRRTTQDDMTTIVAEGKVFYYLLAGLHSPETGPPEMVMELAYRLAVSEKPEIQAIRENVVVLLTPVVEPDGRDRVVEWYYRHLRGKHLPFHELDEFNSPPYWGHYAFHDNNRDGMQLTLPLTRAIHETYYRFHPQVVHDLHESLPLLYISTGHGPYSDAVDPVTVNEWTQFAHHEASELQAMGLAGVWTWGFWDGWWPGYLFSVANNHNSVGRFYETFGNSMAETFERELEDVKFVGKSVTTEQWYRPWPPDKKVPWSLRNNTNYMQAGVLQALEYAASHREELLRNFWVKGKRSMEKGSAEAPYAWIFPEEQRDPARLAYLVNQLQVHKIEVGRLGEAFTSGKKTYPQGSYIVRMDQPYRNAAVNFLSEQKFPADEPNPPYDDVAWTWPLLYGVDGTRIDDKKVLETSVTLVAEPMVAKGSLEGDGPVWGIRDEGQTGLLAARVLLGNREVEAAETTFVSGDVTYPVGSWIVRAPREDIQKIADRFGIDFTTLSETPDVPRHKIDLPRLAVLHTWISTQDCGWVRYTLDKDKIPYTLIADGDLKKGGLKNRFDVILFPRSGGDFAQMVNGIDPKFGPLAYTKTSEYPSHGVPDASDDITGGMGFDGLGNLKTFVEEGGVFVALANAGTLVVEGGIVRNVDGGPSVRTPGSILRAKALRRDHPILYGYEDFPTVFRGQGPLFDVGKHYRGMAVLQFGLKEEEKEEKGSSEGSEMSGHEKPLVRNELESSPAAPVPADSANVADADSSQAPKDKRLVLSGWVKEEGEVNGKPAILDVPTGRGRVVLFNFNPLHRYLNHSDFRYVYNVILNWNDLPGTPPAGLYKMSDDGE